MKNTRTLDEMQKYQI